MVIVPGNMSESLLNIANKPWLMQANILVDMLTALGVIFLGAILFMSLREQNEKIAWLPWILYFGRHTAGCQVDSQLSHLSA